MIRKAKETMTGRERVLRTFRHEKVLELLGVDYLKEHFGGRLSFHGGISTAGVLVTGSPAEVRQMVFDTAQVFNRGGGYMLAPTHLIQDNTPAENILAMYQAAHDFAVE